MGEENEGVCTCLCGEKVCVSVCKCVCKTEQERKENREGTTKIKKCDKFFTKVPICLIFLNLQSVLSLVLISPLALGLLGLLLCVYLGPF